MSLNEHEEAFVRAFIVKDKRARYRQLLQIPKRRRELLDRLNHSPDINFSLATHIPFGHYSVDAVMDLLKRKGAGETCYLMADESEYDGRELPLKVAVEYAIRHPWGIILSCVPGCLAYYKMEEIGSAYLLEHV